MLNFIKDKFNKEFIKSPEKLEERVREILKEDELANSQALKYLDIMPIVNGMYGDDEKAIENNLQLVLNHVNNKQTKSRIEKLLGRYKRYHKLGDMV